MKYYLIHFKDCGEWDSYHTPAMDIDDAEDKFWEFIQDEWGGPVGIRIESIDRV